MMEKLLLFCLALVALISVEVFASEPLELSHDSEEVVYRYPRGIRDRKVKTPGECRYKKGPWEECDAVTNTERRTLTLKRGDSTCEQTKVLTRKCKKACKYDKGEWNECEVSSNMRTRTDTLKPKSSPTCEPTRTISKKCKKICRYNKQAAWDECDATTGKKTKVLVLTAGDPAICQEKKITKPCRPGRKGGKGKQYDEEEDYEDDE